MKGEKEGRKKGDGEVRWVSETEKVESERRKGQPHTCVYVCVFVCVFEEHCDTILFAFFSFLVARLLLQKCSQQSAIRAMLEHN